MDTHYLSRRTALNTVLGALWSLHTPAVKASAQDAYEGQPLRTALRVQHWTRQWLALVVKYQQNPLRAARTGAYVHTAMHLAWRRSLSRSASAVSVAECERSAHKAAALMLRHLYPSEATGKWEAHFAWMGAQCPPLATGDVHTAQAIGEAVANALIERSLVDGASRVWPIQNRPATFTGIWTPTYPLYAVNPTEGCAGEWLPWVQPAATRYVPPPAPRPGSATHTRETLEVLEVSEAVTDAQKQAALDWNLDSGSVTPAGVWAQHALALFERHGMAPHATPAAPPAQAWLHAMATLGQAMHDAFIACWAIKFRDWSERPITAVRRSLRADFAPLLVTPGFPAYVSGHATVSGAAATVLAHFWPQQHDSLQAMAQEAADSRLWGGIHFRGDNEEGLRLGRAVGAEVVASLTHSPAS
jgi:hypothetical protein